MIISKRRGDEENENMGTNQIGDYKEFEISYTLIYDYFHFLTQSDFLEDAKYYQGITFSADRVVDRMKDEINIVPSFSNATIIKKISIQGGWLTVKKSVLTIAIPLNPKDYYPVNISLNHTVHYQPRRHQFVMDSRNRAHDLCRPKAVGFSKNGFDIDRISNHTLSGYRDTLTDISSFIKGTKEPVVVSLADFPESDFQQVKLLVDKKFEPS